MKAKGIVRFILCVVIGLTIVLDVQTLVLAASPGPQTTADWRGEYYANVDLIGEPALVRGDAAINFDWGTGAPAPGLPADNFSVRWTSSSTFEEGIYRFRAVVDDGVRLFVDGVLLIDAWQDGARRELTADRRMAAGQHALRVEYYERGGQALAQVRWEKVSSTVTGDVRWRGEYWANPDLNGEPKLVRADPEINFDWGTGSPTPGLPADNFSARWTRSLTFEEGQYRFRASVDDGLRLFVDGALVIDAWQDGSRRDLTADRRLSAGMHTLRVEYYERQGMAVAQVRWEKLASTVPDDQAWKGEYWANLNLSGSPVLVRNDPTLAFDWGQGSPGNAIPSDNFSARWTRRLNLDAGTYRFHILVDDGVRLWVDSRLILDAWSDHDAANLTVDYAMAGGSYTLKVEYYERIGNARIWLWWEKVTASAYADWKGEYWNNKDLSGEPAVVRNDRTIDFSWGDGSPSSVLPVDNFSARWTRQRQYDAGTYRFRAVADDGVRIWVDGKLIIDAWRDQKPTEYAQEVSLAQGTHTLKVEYYEHTGGARIRVWTETVDAPSYPDWRGEYWSNRNLSGTPVLVRNDKNVDFDWKDGSPAVGVPKDNFSARWSRQVKFSSGRYRLYVRADDGVRVRVNDQLVLDEWHASGGDKEYSTDMSLDGTYSLVVEYYEQGGNARVRFWWKRIGDR
jgi:hypothetical protein